MMEYVVNTVEDMLIKVDDSTNQVTAFDTTTAIYDIYHDDEELISANAVVENAIPSSIVGKIFRCSIAPVAGWGAGKYALFLHLTNIPGRPETPRLGPFRFHVIA